MTAAATSDCIRLHVAFELGERDWKLAFTTGLGQRRRIKRVQAGAVDMVVNEIARTTQ